MGLNEKFFKTIADTPLVPSENFTIRLYTGNGSTQVMTNLGFQPDMVWLKSRSAQFPPYITDVARGTGNVLRSSEKDAESSGDGVSSFDSNGFKVSGGGSNQNNGSYVSWCWKGGGSTSSNSNGSITSQVSANPAAGFSIVKWSGNSTAGATIGHGLNAAPELFITKNIGSTSLNWATYNVTIGNQKRLTVNETNPIASSNRIEWNSTTPTDSVVTLGDHPCVNSTNNNYIGYAFTSIADYQDVGTYNGDNGTDRLINTGFAVRFVMIKRTNATSNWQVFDTQRGGNAQLDWNDISTEYTGGGTRVEFVSNGFKLKSNYVTYNETGGIYIYLAIA